MCYLLLQINLYSIKCNNMVKFVLMIYHLNVKHFDTNYIFNLSQNDKY